MDLLSFKKEGTQILRFGTTGIFVSSRPPLLLVAMLFFFCYEFLKLWRLPAAFSLLSRWASETTGVYYSTVSTILSNIKKIELYNGSLEKIKWKNFPKIQSGGFSNSQSIVNRPTRRLEALFFIVVHQTVSFNEIGIARIFCFKREYWSSRGIQFLSYWDCRLERLDHISPPCYQPFCQWKTSQNCLGRS